jgi:hypothetical protein
VFREAFKDLGRSLKLLKLRFSILKEGVKVRKNKGKLKDETSKTNSK